MSVVLSIPITSREVFELWTGVIPDFRSNLKEKVVQIHVNYRRQVFLAKKY